MGISSAENSISAVEVFLKSWRVYQDIIAHNYMFHREISTTTLASLSEFNLGHKLNILDLGCGDASMALPLLEANGVSSYTGCDLSKPALDIAQQQLCSREIPHKLICDDMLKVVSEQPEGSFDIVFSSYAIHHLNGNYKQKLIEQICRVLTPAGKFLLIDIFREPSEDRAAYMRNYIGRLQQTWVGLSDEDQALVVNHATEYDFPEHADFYMALCMKHGLSHGQQLAKHTWHQAWLYSRAT